MQEGGEGVSGRVVAIEGAWTECLQATVSDK